MKKEIILSFTAILFFSFFLAGCAGLTPSIKESITINDSLALHGSCIIAGKVIDGDTNEPIRGATIVLFSNPTHSVTDLYGQFEFIDIPPGKYMLQIFCVGYAQKDIPDIEAKPDRLIKLEMRLEPRSDRSE